MRNVNPIKISINSFLGEKISFQCEFSKTINRCSNTHSLSHFKTTLLLCRSDSGSVLYCTGLTNMYRENGQSKLGGHVWPQRPFPSNGESKASIMINWHTVECNVCAQKSGYLLTSLNWNLCCISIAHKNFKLFTRKVFCLI